VTRLDDEWLAIRCQLGEPEAFDALVRRWHGPLAAFLRRVSPSEDVADDLVQDVWVRIVRGIGRLRQPGRLRSWIFGIAHRAAADRLRIKYAAPVTVDVGGEELAAPEPDDSHEEDLTRLAEELDRLPVIERETLVLFYLRELTIEEISEALGIPVGTVKSRLFRARNLLRARLERSNP
jgi:RNA polymerase sigma-70 factor (ECF subfamily)